MWQWAFQQGGAFTVILVILFFYRRDWKAVAEYQKEQNTMMVDLVKAATAAQVQCADAIRENTVVSHSLKHVVEKAYYGKRADDYGRQQ